MHYRKTLTPTEFVFGVDSTQGYLEFADSDQHNKSQIVFSTKDEQDYSSHLYRLKQLSRENFIEVEWEVVLKEGGQELYSIKQMSLTTSGRELLEKLRSNSKSGLLKTRFFNLLWVIVTAACTTLVVLYIKGI